MFVGRSLYILGLIFVSFSGIALIITFLNSGEIIFPLFGLLNGFIAMGIGELVIDLNHRKREELKKRD
ncbi:hypothetical protein [Alkalihalobacillus sp. LMS39]|uniref:hypothetical protein n=1 Tax=Alkalihalobacillus sp. LMS39 TaxID=2924032 RepID=UPI001FB3169F|nr:hypothetical protein [Alkalihalobacillus sp. LMS39]UOE95198.1 hypothetical protein MM271_06125 [Alkalihalobacillus sp. LMS39]